MSEIIIYHNLNAPIWKVKGQAFTKFTTTLAKGSLIASLIFAFFIYTPSINFKLSSSDTKDSIPEVSAQENQIYLPPFDQNLPLGNTLSIPAIGVNTEISEASLGDFENALRKGVWRVANFGTPSSQDQPVILVAHRYGYLSWSNTYRRENSFYNLTKLNVGDTIEIIWHQRKYLYEVYGEEEGEEIADYHADLILYTCKFLDSETRVIKYARLLKI